jgi:HAD superfamily hydrolase (TIGR01484 family)
MSDERLLLCTDLDRTLLPNGREAESPQARPLFARLASRAEVTLAYVSGRHKALVEAAIADYALPHPAYAVTDVGTRIYAWEAGRWLEQQEWETDIAADWAGCDRSALERLFADLPALRLQEPAKQNTHKLSYYLSADTDREAMGRELRSRLEARRVRADLVWSVDELKRIGLLDVIPSRATKLHAVEFLMQRRTATRRETVYAGDSGNDLRVMASGVPSVLVANAADDVKAEAVRLASAAGHTSELYLAQGGYLGMNGNYAAGILEGVAHFRPDLAAWMESR